MKKLSPTHNKVHIIGIGGIGTSALARWFLSQSYEVSGSDISSSLITEKLQKEGLKIFIGHKASNVPRDAKLVVRSAALPLDNPEIKKAVEFKIPIKTYAQELGNISKNYKTIAIAGAHGKSTSTSLLSLVLIKAGFDPTVIVGTNLKEFHGKNFRKGKSKYLILEADEYQESFLNYSPEAAMITNIDKEHLDFYKNLDTIKKVFLNFISNIKSNGILILNKDDQNLFSLKKQIEAIAAKNKLKIHWYGLKTASLLPISKKIEKILKISGDHNLSNALGVYLLAKSLGAKEKDILNALSSYHGAWRRMEYRGELKIESKKSKVPVAEQARYGAGKIKVYDDYAHHPTEIKATLSGVRKKFPESELICVFQPHQAKRLETLFKEFTEAFDDADTLILLDIYKVAGRDRTSEVSQNINSLTLKQALDKRLNTLKNVKKGPSQGLLRLNKVIHLPYSKAMPKAIKSALINLVSESEPTIIIMMGAGDIFNYTDYLIK